MSDNQDFPNFDDFGEGSALGDREVPSELKLHICLFSGGKFIDLAKKSLNQDIYQVTIIAQSDSLIDFIQNQQEKIDCLLVTYEATSRTILAQLQKLGILIPAAIAYLERDLSPKEPTVYHSAEVKFNFASSEQISNQINLALTKFLHFNPHDTVLKDCQEIPKEEAEATHNLLISQQRRLTEKLKERLGYLGVYYKRNSQDFYRNLTNYQQKKLEQQIAVEYRKIILSYFEDEPNINQIIDRFVNSAFFSDISVSQILEIHMELMDEFAQQLKLEGRNEDILLDYRLALIDIIAHLCEMYRRSIPREDIPLNLLFGID